jgi:uncharacterized membrane protein
MLCQKCGYENNDNVEFCRNCGTKLEMGGNTSYNQKTNTVMPPGSQSGSQKTTSAMLCYVFGWVTGIIFLLIEKDRFVRFHAVQSIFTFGGLTVIRIMLSFFISLVLWRLWFVVTLLNSALTIATVVAWVLLMIKAYQGQWYKLPYVGDLAEKYSN